MDIEESLKHEFTSARFLSLIIPYFEKCDKKTLILFDVDSTLLTPSDPYMRRYALIKHKEIYSALTNKLTSNQLQVFKHLLVTESPSQLLDPKWPYVIAELQSKGVKTLAMTASIMGQLGLKKITRFAEWRYDDLKKFGIDFSATFENSSTFKDLNEFGNEHHGIEKGIIYCGHILEKGLLLKHVLSHFQWQPDNIIFIDDKENNLISLSKALKH